MAVISVLSLKGGVGKTSVTLGLAGAATLRGMATLVIDLDPQGNATSLLATRRSRTTVADVLATPNQETVEAALSTSPWEVEPGEVDVMPSHPEVIRFDSWTGTRVFRPRLRRAMRFLDGYDLVLIDCPPSFGALTREALAASDVAAVVTTPSYFGAQGVDYAMREIKEIQREVNPELVVGGIIVNRVRSSADEHEYRLHELGEIYGRPALFRPYIPERMVVQQAESTGQPVQLMRGVAAEELTDIYGRYLRRLLRAVPKPEADDEE